MSSSDTQQEARTAAEVLARGLWRMRPGLSAFNYWAKDEDDVVQKYPHGDSASRRRGSLKEAERLVAALADAGYRIVGPDQVVVDRENLGGMIKQVVDASLDSQEDVTRD